MARRRKINDMDAEKLRWVGFLGHRYVVLYDDKGEVRCALETNSLQSASDCAREREADAGNGRVYEQVRASKWRGPVALLPAAAEERR